MLHDVPSQCSMRVRSGALFWKYPTAQALEEETAATPSSRLRPGLGGALGLFMMLHDVPSQCSMRVRVAPIFRFSSLPTAQASESDVAATATSTAWEPVLGLGCTDPD